MSAVISGEAVRLAMSRAAAAVAEQSEYLTELDQALGDGDMGINMAKIAAALKEYAAAGPGEDIGGWLAQAGMAANKAGPSTMGTLVATALMRAGKAVKGKAELSPDDLAAMLEAADQGIQERGKAKPGDKTIIDALHPAAGAFRQALAEGQDAAGAGRAAAEAARAGLESVTPLRSRVGRAGWVGERTEGKQDPGCTLACIVLESVIG